MVIESSKQRLK